MTSTGYINKAKENKGERNGNSDHKYSNTESLTQNTRLPPEIMITCSQFPLRIRMQHEVRLRITN